jgi:hypothetical protein
MIANRAKKPQPSEGHGCALSPALTFCASAIISAGVGAIAIL